MTVCLLGKMPQKCINICHIDVVLLLSPYHKVDVMHKGLPVPVQMRKTACRSLKDTSFSLEHQVDSIDTDSVSVNMTPGYCLKCDSRLYNQRHRGGWYDQSLITIWEILFSRYQYHIVIYAKKNIIILITYFNITKTHSLKLTENKKTVSDKIRTEKLIKQQENPE